MKGITALSLSILLVGCSSPMVVTNKYSSETPKAAKGILYSIPKQNFEFSVVREKVTKTKLAKDVTDTKAEKAAVQAFIGEKDVIINTLAPLIVSAAGKPNLLTELKLRSQLATLEKAELNKKLAKLTTSLANAEARLQNANIAEYSFEDSIKLVALTPQPSSTKLLATLNSSGRSSDTFEIKTTESGLLSGGSAKSEGNIDEIIVALAKAAGSTTSPKIKSSSFRDNQQATAKCPQEELSFKYEIDLAAAGWEADLNTKMQGLGLCYSISVNRGGVYKLNAAGKAYTEELIVATVDKNTEGLVYPRKSRYHFTIQGTKDNASFREILGADAVDLSALGYISLDKGNFATNDYEFDFVDGLLTRYKAVKPSEVIEALAMIPRAATALIEIPAEMLKLRVDYSSQEESFYEKQKNSLIAKEALEEAKRQADEGTLLDDDTIDSTTD